MSITLKALLFAVSLFCGMLFLLELGRRIGLAQLIRDPEGAHKGVGAVEGAVFALLGLLIAFIFSGAASRFDDRRQLVAEETNIIGTAYLRIDLLPADAQPEMRELFRRYLDLRLETYRNVGDAVALNAKLAQSAALQQEIWAKALFACRRPDAHLQASMLVLPALNQMIDITTTRLAASYIHPPRIIYLLLGGLSLIAALLAGYSMSESKVRSLVHMMLFAVVMSLAVYVILDLEYPRQGMIRVDAADQFLIALRKSMH